MSIAPFIFSTQISALFLTLMFGKMLVILFDNSSRVVQYNATFDNPEYNTAVLRYLIKGF